MRLLPFALVASLLAAPAVAHADSGTSYSAEIGVIDGGTTALALGYAIGSKDDGSVVPFYILTGVVVLAGPVDHAAHGHDERAGLSLGAHLALPALGGVIGAATADNKSFASIANIFAGILVGHLAAMGVDMWMAQADATPPTATPRMLTFGGAF